jgi:hypothetical protein
MVMEKKLSYVAKGYVLGIDWFGSKCAYPTRAVKGSSIEEIESNINQMIESNVLDNGMGFQSLIGALMVFRTTTEIVVDDMVFINNQYQGNFYGELSEEEKNFLDEMDMEETIGFSQNC